MEFMAQPLISIIAPVYNTEPYVSYMIDSVLEQTYPNWELILVDDGSSDTSGAICDRYAGGKIKVFHTENAGVSAARNTGLMHAKGEYIVFCDSDDMVVPDFLRKLYTAITSYNADIAYCDAFELENEFYSPIVEQVIHPQIKTYKKDDIVKLPMRFYHVVWGKIYRADLITSNHIQFDVQLSRGEDSLFIYLVSLCSNSIVHLEEKLVNYRIRTGSLMRSSTPNTLFRQALKRYVTLTEFEKRHTVNKAHLILIKKDAVLPVLTHLCESHNYRSFLEYSKAFYSLFEIQTFIVENKTSFTFRYRVIISMIEVFHGVQWRWLLYFFLHVLIHYKNRLQ